MAGEVRFDEFTARIIPDPNNSAGVLPLTFFERPPNVGRGATSCHPSRNGYRSFLAKPDHHRRGARETPEREDRVTDGAAERRGRIETNDGMPGHMMHDIPRSVQQPRDAAEAVGRETSVRTKGH